MAWGTAELAELLGGLDLAVEVEEDELRVGLSSDDPEHPRPASVRLADSPREGAARLLRVDVTYPFHAPDVTEARVAGALLDPYLVLGRTEVDDDGSVHHRYAMLVDVEAPLSEAVLPSVLGLLDYEQLHFGDYLEAWCEQGAPARLFARLVEQGEASGLD